MRTRQYTIKNLVKWFIPFYLFTFLPLQAQVGTWKNHLAYHEIQDICSTGNELFVLASNALYQYHLNDQSIVTYDRTNGLSDTYITHIAWSQQARRLIIIYGNSNIDLIDPDGRVINISALYDKTMTEDKTITDIRIDGVFAYLVTNFAIIKVNIQKAEITGTYTPNHPQYPTSLPEKNRTDYEKYISMVSTLKPVGPVYNHHYESTFTHGRLFTTGGYFLPGIPDPGRQGIIQMFDGNNWTSYDETVNQTTGYDYKDICCIDVDPYDESHVFAGGRCGLYEFMNGKLVRYFNQDNSPLKGAIDRGTALGNDYVLILGIKFDNDGNLWVLNSQADGVSLLEYTTEKEWIDHHHHLLADNHGVSLAALRCMSFDNRNLLWFVNDNWFDPAVFCYDRTNDVVHKYHTFINQDGTKYNVKWVYCVCEDKEGDIWIGTDIGPFIIKNEEVGQEEVTFYQMKIPRNDGTNYADYLLNGVSINSIAVDGGNRKWLGTDGNGAFLISSDNLEQLENFTSDNSKLISNHVSSISINNLSGEIFFITDKGLCSYLGFATEPNEEMTKENVYAYPNPVYPDYTGLITITGLTYHADVKIVTSNGALVVEGRSNGGMFTWDGCDRKGKRVASGVYMVVTATSDGKKGVVCKIAVIN